MISGYPHQGGGLFDIACGLVEKSLSQPVESSLVSLGGFPAPRAAKYLASRVLGFSPHFVVLQFGATDAQRPIRTRNRPIKSARFKTSADCDYHRQPANAVSSFRWELVSVMGYVLKIEPITPLPSYIAAIERMVDDCRSAGSTSVVLSPFVYGSRYTMKRAFSYLDALQKQYAGARGVVLVDCVSLLKNFPKRLILQHDGFHLSRLAQTIVGEAIGEAIVDNIRSSSVLSSAGNSFEQQRIANV
jgi:hypothetical protein